MYCAIIPSLLNGLQENVAVVEFGEKARVVQGLTNDYSKCRRAIGMHGDYRYLGRIVAWCILVFVVDSLKPGGRTPMFHGLMESLKEIVTNGLCTGKYLPLSLN